MSGIHTIFDSISNLNSVYAKQLFVRAIDEHQSFGDQESSLQGILTSILNKSKKTVGDKQHEGTLLFYDGFLQQCPVQLIEKKGNAIVNHLLGCINKKDEFTAQAYSAIGIMVEKSVNIPELSKNFSNNLLIKIFETLNSVQPQSFNSALKCIQTCMKLYPGSCGAFRSQIQRFLYSNIDTSDKVLVLNIAKCLLRLQQIRGGSNRNQSQRESWLTYQTKLIGSLHQLLNTLFASCPQFASYTCTETLEIDPLELSHEPVERTAQLINRFANLIIVLKIALRDPFSASKMVAVTKLLNLVERGLAVNCAVLEQNLILDNIALGALIPLVHIELLRFSESLILLLRSHLTAHAKTILNFVTFTLKWTSSGKPVGRKKPFTSLRSSAYRTLSVWLETLKYGSLTEIVAEEIIENIKNDSMHFKNAVTLKVLMGAKKHMSKKARKQLHRAQNEASNLVQTHAVPANPNANKAAYSDLGNDVLCSTALNCLELILRYSSCFLKPTLLKDIHLHIFQLAVNVSEYDFVKGKLYSSPDCRAALYKTAAGCVLFTHILCPPPFGIALNILTSAKNNDTNYTVREVCAQELSSLEKIIHPEKNSLYFPMNVNDFKNAFKNSKYDFYVDSEQSEVDERFEKPMENRENITSNQGPEDNATETIILSHENINDVIDITLPIEVSGSSDCSGHSDSSPIIFKKINFDVVNTDTGNSELFPVKFPSADEQSEGSNSTKKRLQSPDNSVTVVEPTPKVQKLFSSKNTHGVRIEKETADEENALDIELDEERKVEEIAATFFDELNTEML